MYISLNIQHKIIQLKKQNTNVYKNSNILCRPKAQLLKTVVNMLGLTLHI